jgi:hypothetical protein
MSTVSGDGATAPTLALPLDGLVDLTSLLLDAPARSAAHK